MSWTLIRSGVGLLRAGKTQEALERLNQAAQAMAQEPRAFIQLALAQLESGQPEAALENLRRVLEFKEQNPAPALYYMALAQLDLGLLDEALQSVRRLQELSPENQALPTLRALLHLRCGEIDQALLALEVPPAPPSPGWQRPELSSFAPLTSRLVLELEEWLLPLEVPRLRNSKATDQPSPALAENREPVREDRVRASLVGMIGGAVVGAAAGIGVRGFMRITIGADLDYSGVGWFEPAMGLGSVFGLAGACWGFLKPDLPRRWQAYYTQLRGYRLLEKALRCESLHQRKQYFMLAIQTMHRVVELGPALLRSHYCLGEALLFAAGSLRDPEWSERFLPESEQCFIKSWEQDGENPYLNYYMARSCQLQGKIDAAITYYGRAIDKFSKLSEGHYGLAQCHLLRGDKAEARRWFSRALGSELQLARDRLQDLGNYFSDGLLSKRPSFPQMPEPEPEIVEILPDAPEAGALAPDSLEPLIEAAPGTVGGNLKVEPEAPESETVSDNGDVGGKNLDESKNDPVPD